MNADELARPAVTLGSAAAAAASAAVLLAAAWLFARALAPPSVAPRRLGLATLALGLPLAAGAVATAFLAPRLGALLALLALLPGLPLARHLLGPPVHAAVPEALARRLGMLGLAALLFVTAACGLRAARLHAPRHAAGAAVRAGGEPAGEALAEPRVLDAGNALEFAAERRNCTIDVAAALEPGAALEIRVRAPAAEGLGGLSAQGLALFVSADPSLDGGFFREAPGAFEPLGAPLAPLRPAEGVARVEVRVSATGERFTASIDGHEVAQAHCDRFPSGAIQVLAARGRVRVDDLSIRPIAAAEAGDDAGTFAAWACDVVPWLAIVPLALLAAAALARRRLGAARPFALAALGAAFTPPALLLVGAGRVDAAPASAVGAALIAVSFSVAALGGLRRMGGTSRVALPAAGAAALAVALAASALARAPGPPDLMALNHLPYFEGGLACRSVERLWLTHPLLRRYDFWLVRHEFRGRRHARAAAPGVRRVMALGTSSTFGIETPLDGRFDYPAVMEDLLNAAGGPRVEVLNAAVPAATGARLFRRLRDALAVFEPEVVTLSLRFNDAYVLTAADEESWYPRLVE